MAISSELVAEMEILRLFDLSNPQEGIKVHKTAGPVAVEAVGRLHTKGLVSQVDGGYLTDLGREAAEHADTLLRILTTG